jgi:BirA family biotin operon repressor/biotin-[acetyl-CoA-carboxylase] ligase
MSLGAPRVHFRLVDSTNRHGRELAERGAPHGTLVTAAEQSAGRGRQGRSWVAPPGRAILCSLVLREHQRMLPLSAGVAVAELAGPQACVKWPNDVLLEGRKIAGILVEGRPREGWAVLGIGVNVAVTPDELPPELRDRAGGLGLVPEQLEPALERLLALLERWIEAPEQEVLAEFRARDALLGRHLRWAGGDGEAAGIDDDGRLLVQTGGRRTALEAGEVHLG